MCWLVILGFTSLCYLDSTSNTINQLIKLQKGQWYSHPLWHLWSFDFLFLLLIVEPIGFREDTLIPIIWSRGLWSSPCLNCAIVAWSMWPELACMWVKQLLTSTIARQLTHLCTSIELLSLNCAFFLTGAYVCVLSHPLICVWAAAKGCECELNCCWHL